GHESAVRQLTSILLDNARKYSPDASHTALTLARTGGHTVLSVSNPTETEVRTQDLNRVFDRFYRTDPSRNSETGGNGIGLSIAQAIVQSHGGRIRASTESGRDFTITVTFPH
ncbi:MAG: ATP-binding protein, partial [Oscillospiraceae bacterium]|nr:ATP-binding protein [Oscillospiraceae bacterium]